MASTATPAQLNDCVTTRLCTGAIKLVSRLTSVPIINNSRYAIDITDVLVVEDDSTVVYADVAEWMERLYATPGVTVLLLAGPCPGTRAAMEATLAYHDIKYHRLLFATDKGQALTKAMLSDARRGVPDAGAWWDKPLVAIDHQAAALVEYTWAVTAATCYLINPYAIIVGGRLVYNGAVVASAPHQLMYGPVPR